jgi:hypothetical protein
MDHSTKLIVHSVKVSARWRSISVAASGCQTTVSKAIS